MRLFGWFRRPKPAPARQISEYDNLVIAAHGLSQEQWAELTWSQRAHYRATMTKGAHFEDVL